MAVPVQVQQQKDLVKDMFDEHGALKAPVAAQPTHVAVVPPASPPNAPPAPPPPPAPAPTPPQTDTVAQWEQKYRTLQGMYNADTARLRAEVAQAQSDHASVLARLNALEARVQTPTPPVAATKHITPEDEREYEGTIEVMRRAAREEVSAEVTALKAQIATMQQQLGGLSNVSTSVDALKAGQEAARKQAFWDTVNGAVPNWRDINVDPAFHAWLLEVDTTTGANKQMFLKEARDAYDAQGVVRFFRNWLEFKNGSGQPAPTSTPSPTGAEPTELELQTAPNRSRGTPDVVEGAPKIISRKDISDFFAEVVAGKWAARPAEKAAREAEIFAAQKEGRVR